MRNRTLADGDRCLSFIGGGEQDVGHHSLDLLVYHLTTTCSIGSAERRTAAQLGGNTSTVICEQRHFTHV